jgi:hypothetical protein
MLSDIMLSDITLNVVMLIVNTLSVIVSLCRMSWHNFKKLNYSERTCEGTIITLA